MADTDIVASLLNQPLPAKLTKVGQPQVSELVQTRRLEQANKKPFENTRLAYMTYDDMADDTIYDPTDFHTVGNLIRNNVAKAITERFPVTNEKYTLTIENLAYETPKNKKLANEKDILQHEKSLMDALRGEWVLYDTATGKEIERKRATILNVPRMTQRGTFIRNGSEIGLKHMFRLRPGIYARIKADGTPSVHINPAQTTGRQMSLNMDQESGVMTISRGTRTYGVLPLLKAAGVSDDTIKAAWGDEVYNMNLNKYVRLLKNTDTPQFEEYRKLWTDGFLPIKLDEETTMGTMGKPYGSMSAEVLLGASNKALKLSRTMSTEDEDDRDSLAYQRIMGPADYIPERIVRDGGGLLRKMFQRVLREGNLNSIESGAFQPQVDSVFTEDKHAGYIDGASPFEGLDYSQGVSRIGEGGIGDTRAAPAETRGVNDSYLGFIDPIRSPESMKVGLEVYLTYGVKKDSKGNLYANFIGKDGKSALRPMSITAKSVIATPEYYDPQADPEEFIPAFYRGKGIEYVKRKDVDFFLESSNNMMSIGAGMIPNIGGIRSNRTLMGCLDPETLIDVYRDGYMVTQSVGHYLTGFRHGDKIACLTDDFNGVELREIRGVVKVDNFSRKLIHLSTHSCPSIARVTHTHKCLVSDGEGNIILKKAKDVKVGEFLPVATGSYDKLLRGSDAWYNLVWVEITEVTLEETIYDYAIDLDVNDSVFMLHSGVFTHNSKYPLQALSLDQREVPLVQRAVTAGGQNTTTERLVAKQLGAKFAPVTGKVIKVDDDEIIISGADGSKHAIDLYNMYPANQKGYLHNTAIVKEGDRVHEGDLLADSNYTRDGSAALGTNLKVAFVTGHGSELFEDAIAISESCAKKLASEQLYKFRGDLSSDTAYGKQRFLNLFGTEDYTADQLEKIDENGMPKIGVKFQKGDPVFLGIQIRDLSTSGLSRNAAVPYVKTWEHDAEGTVVDVVKGRKHMTVYTRAFTPMQLGDKMCYDDKTEIMTKRGWILFQDLLSDDEVLTLDIRTGENYFTAYEAAFKYRCEKEPLYRLVTKNLDIATTANHKHLVAAMNNARYLDFQTSEQIFGKHRWFITGCNLESAYSYKSSREEGAKEKWEKYTGYVYCITVPQTHTMYVRRNGKAVWSGNSGRYGDKSVVSCYDDATMIFTSEGFKPFPELTVNDKVAVLDPNTRTAHFETPKEVQHAPYSGTMYGYQDRNLSWLVTPTHDMWTTPCHINHKRHPENAEYRRWNVTEMFGKRYKHVIAAQFNIPEGTATTVSIPPVPVAAGIGNSNPNNGVLQFDVHDFAEFLGWYLSEGHISHSSYSGKWDVVITQSEKDSDPVSIARCDAIRNLLTRMGLVYHRRGIQFVIVHKALWHYLSQFGKSADKYIPEELFTEWPRTAQLKFLDTLYLGDGDSSYINVRRYSTCSPQLRDDLMRLCTLLGMQASWAVAKKAVEGSNRHELYRISMTTELEACSKRSKYQTKCKSYYTEEYEGTIHCCTVSTGIIYVMRDGKPMWCGNSIIPDNEMPRDENGEIYDALKSPLSLPSRLNTSMLGEVALAKIAKKTGRVFSVPDFITDDTIDSYVAHQLNKYGVSATTTIFDPRSNKHIEGVTDGYMFHYKLKHMSELKERGRGTGIYSSEEVPLKGEGAARRLGMMETSAVYSGGGMDVLKDAKLIRGQRNDEFWRDYRDGKYPDIPGTPLVHKKFFAHLVASGANIERNTEGFRLSAATDTDIKELTQNRQVTRAATFDSKNMQPIDGGLFDQAIFGADGDQWGYYELPEPVLNPLMFKPVASILGWSDTELREYLQGSRGVDGKYGPEYVMSLLNNVDLPNELKKAKDLLKSGQGTLQQKDLARKRIRAITPLLRDGVKPADLFFTRMPILPPRFRTVSVINGGETNIAADVNFLYKRMMDAGADLQAAKEQLPGEYQVDARESMYNAINAVVGLMPTDDPKLEAKGVSGLLKWAFGKGSPKLSSLHKKVFGSNLDMGGLGTIIPDSRLTIDQVGIPEESAWSMYEPFVVRELRQRGYSMVQAMKEVMDRSKEARTELERVMSKRPVLLNRAPTLWRYGIQGMYPVIVEGRAIRVNPNICKVYGGDFDGNCCDFDSKIFVKLSKSSLEIFKSMGYIKGNAKANNKEDNMSVTKNSVITVQSAEGNLQMMSIGEFPKVGEPRKDKNGADVYDLLSGVEVMSVNPVTGEVSFNQATNFTEEKDCDCVRITVGGRTATVSTNATLAVFDTKEGRLIKVAASEHKDRLIPLLKKLPIDYGTQYDRDFGWWLGALISDGWISANIVGYTKVEEVKRHEFVRIARSINENFTMTEYAASKGSDKLGDSVKVHLYGKDLADMCRSFGVYDESSELSGGRSALIKQIPYAMILNGSEDFLWGLLSGLLDGDGSITKNTAMKNPRFGCRFSTSSPSLRETFEFLLYRLGIRYTTTVTPPRNWSSEAYTISPSTVDMFYALGKLTCIGERERGLISEWSEHPPAQDNTDVIPISEAELQILRKAKLASCSNTLYSALGRPSRCASRALAKKHLGFIEPLAPEFAARIKNENTVWRPVAKIENVGKRDVYDFAIPDTKVFVIDAGITIYDSMTTHVPVSQTAIDAIDKYMLPSRNLLSPKDFKANFIPRDASNEGLYLASRVGKGSPIRFKTEEEAQAAYDRGDIKIDTPIIIG